MMTGTCERPADCAARNPKLVYGRMTGWGQDGPLAKAAGHDINYIALTGALFGALRVGFHRRRQFDLRGRAQRHGAEGQFPLGAGGVRHGRVRHIYRNLSKFNRASLVPSAGREGIADQVAEAAMANGGRDAQEQNARWRGRTLCRTSSQFHASDSRK